MIARTLVLMLACMVIATGTWLALRPDASERRTPEPNSGPNLRLVTEAERPADAIERTPADVAEQTDPASITRGLDESSPAPALPLDEPSSDGLSMDGTAADSVSSNDPQTDQQPTDEQQAIAAARADPTLPGVDRAGADGNDNGVADGTAGPAVAVGASACFRLGPFDTPAGQRRASERLQDQVARVRERETSRESAQDFRVYLATAENREAALALARQLNDKGVRDYFVVTGGEWENSISLGVFRNEQNARRRLNAVVALGFEARLEARRDVVPEWWLDIAVAGGQDWRAAFAGSQPPPATALDCATLTSEP